MNLDDGIVASNTVGKIDYIVINDASDTDPACLLKFVDAGVDTPIGAAELTIIGSIAISTVMPFSGGMAQ